MEVRVCQTSDLILTLDPKHNGFVMPPLPRPLMTKLPFVFSPLLFL